MNDASFYELRGAGLVAAHGPDAAAFIHGQLTSDVAGLGIPQTQYSGYCSPKGRLLATCLVWRLRERLFLQLPLALCESVQLRLAKYVMRAHVTLIDATPEWRLFGVAGKDAAAAVSPFADRVPVQTHGVAAAADVAISRLPDGRYLILAPAAKAAAIRAVLEGCAREQPESAWMRLDIGAGIPWIMPQTQDAYIPQMVNLDLIGAVSYSKGCYPGQEIVARTHYLGRLKQRMYRIHVAGEPAPGDPLFTALFGAEQASGSIVNTAPRDGDGHDALAVIQSKAITGSVHWKSPGGPQVELLSLPYLIPA